MFIESEYPKRLRSSGATDSVRGTAQCAPTERRRFLRPSLDYKHLAALRPGRSARLVREPWRQDTSVLLTTRFLCLARYCIRLIACYHISGFNEEISFNKQARRDYVAPFSISRCSTFFKRTRRGESD
jgi:hypothetical protein